MTDRLPELSVIILSWNTKDYLRACLSALPAACGTLTHEVVVIDNASHDGSADMVAALFPGAVLERNPDNRGYAIGVNQGLAKATGRYLALLGSDTEAAKGSLEMLVRFLEAHPKAAAVAPRLENFDGTIQRACMRFPRLRTLFWWDTPLQHFFPEGRELRRYQMKDWDHVGTREVDQPPGTCLVVPRAIYESVGPMDEALWLFFNDVDWAKRMRAVGHEIWYLDEARVKHHLGGSTRNFADFGTEWHRNRIRYYRKHHGFLGAFFSKAALTYCAVRQCVRIRPHIPARKDWWIQSKMILATLRSILKERR